jgi:hypothetical protein
MGTHREHDGNKGKKVKIPPPQKEKNWTAHQSILSLSLAAWNVSFQNCLSPFSAWATPPKKKKEKNSSPHSPPPPQEEKYRTLVRAR